MTRARIYKIVYIAMAVLVLAAFGYYLFSFERDTMQFAKVEEIVLSDTVTAEGVFVRDEETVSYDGGGYLVYEAESGKKIEKGGLIASAYYTEQDVSKRIAEEILQNRLDILNKALNSAAYSTNELGDIEAKVYSLYCKAAAMAAKGMGAAACEITEEINYLLCRKQVIIATSEQRIAMKEELEREVSQIAVSKPFSSVLSEKSGYFVSAADGYEALLSTYSLNLLTPEYIDSMKQYQPGVSDKWIGKLITNYKWYFCAVLDKAQAEGIKKGAGVFVLFPFSGSKPFEMTVSDLIYGQDGRVTAVLSSSAVTAELMNVRQQTAAITKTTVNGLKIDIRAVKMADGEVGVYAVRNGVLEFLPIEILSATDEYYIAKWNDSNDKTVMLYDEIVVSGRDLYDGKLVK